MAPIIISIILFFALVIAYYLYRYELEGSPRSRIASIALFFNSVAATITIIFLMFQTAQLTESVKIQTQTFSHEHRPYLFVSLNNHQLPIKGLPNITRVNNGVRLADCASWRKGVKSLSLTIQVKTTVSGALSNLAPMSMFKPDPMESTYIRRRSWN
jgi:hypothetical protein